MAGTSEVGIGGGRPVLRVDGVHKRYGDTEVLRDVSLELPAGRVLGLLGPNGAGKTSLIRMILDLTRPDSGRLEVLGEKPSAHIKDRIGYLPEERGLYPKQKVLDVLAYLVGLSGIERAEARTRSMAWLERVGLAEFAQKKVRTLSKGMQQKLQFGAAILHEPELVILDEPFTGLDPVNRRLVGEVVRELVTRGAGVIVSTHLLDQAQQLCDEVVLIRRGDVILSGGVEAVRERFGEGRIELRAKGPWREAESVRPLVASIDEARGLDVITLVPGAEPERFLAAVVESGSQVEHFSRALPTLEEVFVRAVDHDGDVDRLREELHAAPTAEVRA